MVRDLLQGVCVCVHEARTYVSKPPSCFTSKVSVTLTDGRVLVGVLMAVDRRAAQCLALTELPPSWVQLGAPLFAAEALRHVNIVLCNTEARQA